MGGSRRDREADASEEQTRPRSDDRFGALVRALPLGVIMLNRRLRVRFANRAASAIFGFDPSRARGSHLIEAIPSIELEQRADAALRGEVAEAPLIVAGRSVDRTYAVSVYPLSDESENITGALVLAEDQTEVLALERARQEFLSNVSHELRTPLSSIRLMLETVAAQPDQETSAVFVPQALTQVDRLTSLVHRLLEQARAESGNLQLNFEDVDLEAIVRPIVQSFEPQAVAKGVQLQVHALRPVRLPADPERVAQVMVNLVDNALRFTPPEGTVTTEIDAEGGFGIITVHDTGIGIPYKDLPHVFERFFVVDRSRARDASGVGLGLSIVKQIVEAHGGTVRAESPLGGGASFVVRIPMSAAREGP